MWAKRNEEETIRWDQTQSSRVENLVVGKRHGKFKTSRKESGGGQNGKVSPDWADTRGKKLGEEGTLLPNFPRKKVLGGPHVRPASARYTWKKVGREGGKGCRKPGFQENGFVDRQTPPKEIK